MAIVVERKLGMLDRIYLPAIMRGMWITLKHLFKRKVTLQYPEQRWEFPDASPQAGKGPWVWLYHRS